MTLALDAIPMRLALAAALSLMLAAPAMAGGNAAAGATKAATCIACHGPAGNAPISPDYPKLAGQYEDYLANALHDYQKGARKNPIMAAQAQPLSQQDIADLAAYFSSQSGNLVSEK
jgi:cytochrome c553